MKTNSPSVFLTKNKITWSKCRNNQFFVEVTLELPLKYKDVIDKITECTDVYLKDILGFSDYTQIKFDLFDLIEDKFFINVLIKQDLTLFVEKINETDEDIELIGQIALLSEVTEF